MPGPLAGELAVDADRRVAVGEQPPGHRDDPAVARERAEGLEVGLDDPVRRGGARSGACAQSGAAPATPGAPVSRCSRSRGPRTDTVGPVWSRHRWRNRVRPQRAGRPARACRAGPAAAAGGDHAPQPAASAAPSGTAAAAARLLRRATAAASAASPAAAAGDYGAPPPPPPPGSAARDGRRPPRLLLQRR